MLHILRFFNFKSIKRDVNCKHSCCMVNSIEAKEMNHCDTTKMALFITATPEGAILAAKASADVQDYVDTIEILEEYLKQFINR